MMNRLLLCIAMLLTLTNAFQPVQLSPITRGTTLQQTFRSIALQAASGWINPSTIVPSQINLPPSPIEVFLIRDRLVYVKHDDRLHLPQSNVSGNKARKFYALNNIPASAFPDAIVSYGGPQSNAMVALAAIVSSKNRELDDRNNTQGETDHDDNLFSELDVIEDDIRLRAEEDEDYIESMTIEDKDFDSMDIGEDELAAQPKRRFIYYTKPIPRYLKKNPNGNFLRALALGMEMRTLPHDEYSRLFGGMHGGSSMAPADLDIPVPGKSLWMPQGGACSLAQPGSDVLATEIVDFWGASGKGMALAVCLPGGTCTTALLLHRSIQKLLHQSNYKALDIRVVVIPCVGDDEYALRQMVQLDKTIGGNGKDMPWILRPRADIEYGSTRRKQGGYFTFGHPAAAILETFDEMNEEGLNLDLIYGAPAFSLLLQHWKVRDDPSCPISGRQIMYVHSGGLEGISSQLTRYKHNGLLDNREIMA
jgi:1-aminocyclopropane-1-carboxylate deaminase/D-cysteine desulfhydrase-like pyridoxal-dependent ACC family enzyme